MASGPAASGTWRSAGSERLPFGTFTYRVVANETIWSSEVFEIFGFAPGEVVPGIELMARHVHRDDRAEWAGMMHGAVATSSPSIMWHRVVDAKRKLRSVLTVAHPGTDNDGRAVLTAFIVELSDPMRRRQETDTRQAVQQSAATRGLIDQAKGIVMAVLELTEEQAFVLLRHHSANTNVKLRDVASAIVERIHEPGLADLGPRQRLDAILTALNPTRQQVAARTDPIAAEPGASDRDRPRLSAADLPRTMVRAVAHSSQSISIADMLLPDRPLVYVNDAFTRLTGYQVDDVLGRNCRFLQGADSEPAAVDAMRTAIRAGLENRTVLLNHRKDGSPFWNEVHMSPIHDETGRLTHYIGYQLDVSERVAREHQLEDLAYTDARTGLPNEDAAVSQVEAMILSGARQISVYCVQVSGLRDRGAEAAPGTAHLVLTGVADLLRSMLAPEVLVAKLDNDSFLIAGANGIDLPPEVLPALADELSTDAPDLDLGIHLGRADFLYDAADAITLVEVARSNALTGVPQG